MRITQVLAILSCGLMLSLSAEGFSSPALQNDASKTLIMAQAADTDGSMETSKKGKSRHYRHNKKKYGKKARQARQARGSAGSVDGSSSAE